MRYFSVSLNNVLSQGPFTIYFNEIANGNITQIYESTDYTQDLTVEQITSGVIVQVPDNTIELIIYDKSLCQSFQTIEIAPVPVTYDSFCFSIIGTPFTQGAQPVVTQIYFEYTNTDINDKPSYSDSGNTYSIFWTGTNWLLEGTDIQGTITSNDTDNTPDSGWIVNGPMSSFYTISVQIGECQVANNASLRLTTFPPECSNRQNGQIIAEIIGGVPPYEFSLNNVSYISNSNDSVFTFLNLGQGNFSVTAQDNNGSYTETTNLTAQQQTIYTAVFQNMQPTTGLQVIGCTNNKTYFNLTGSLVFSPSLPTNIPNLNLLLKSVITLTYNQPGSASIQDFNIIGANGQDVINFIQPQPISFTSGGIACSNSSYSVLTGLALYNANATYVSNYPITFTIQFSLDMSKCSIIETCQTIAKVSVQLFAQNITSSYGNTCAQFVNGSYNSGDVEFSCSNNPCNS
jgi:hypothetical protein